MKKVAVAIIHGAGIHQQGHDELDNMVEMQTRLIEKFIRKTGENPLVFRLIYWDERSQLQTRQDELHKTLVENDVDFKLLSGSFGFIRQYIYDRMGDIVAYQPVTNTELEPVSTYSIVHRTVAEALAELSQEELAGPEAPLCIISHSLGTIVASNYIYDLNRHTPNHQLIPKSVLPFIGTTPLEWGRTLRAMFTMGSPMALWRLRTGKLDKPIRVPIWINYFDDDDIIAYPLQDLLVKDHGEILVTDHRVETGMTPLSHTGYWTNEELLDEVVEYLIFVWKSTKDDPV